MPSRIEQARQEYKCKSLFDLHVAKQQWEAMTEEHKVIVALIEMRKERRDSWTLVAALVAAIVSVVGLFLQHCI
jgi:hypothetical protein